MAVAIYFEARNQPIAGQLAVAHVISNRVTRKHRCQFSFWCDGKPETIQDYNAWRAAVRIATAVRDTSVSRVDVSEGATHYHTTEVSPKWRYTLRMTVQIGQHVFYKP